MKRTAVVLVAVLLSGASQPAKLAAQDTAKRSPEIVRGRGIFLQRCSICHLLKLRSTPIGPLLTEALKSASAREVARVREKILNGAGRMPGFRYGLEPREIDDLLTFIKTL